MTEHNFKEEPNGDFTLTLSPKTSTQIAELYGISLKTFYKWVAPFKNDIGEKIGRFYNIAQVKTILEKLGLPQSKLKL